VTMTGGVGIDTSSSSTTLVALNAGGGLFYTTGSSASGWQPFDQLGRHSVAGAVMADAIDADAVAESAGSTVVAVTGDGHVWIAKQQSGGTWTRWDDLELTTTTTLFFDPITGTASGFSTSTSEADVGTFARISAASTSVGLHVVGVTTNGRLWHQLRSTATAMFADVERVGVGQDVGGFTAVACA
jgi:hypothetical protein